jgi:phosphatidate cytidylyltransferase
MALSNRITRIAVAVIAIPILLFAAIYGKVAFLIFALFVGGGAFYEFASMLKNKDVEIPLSLGEAFVFLIILNAYFQFVAFEVIVILVPIFISVYELFAGKKSVTFNAGATLLGIFYVGLFSSLLVKIREFFPEEIVYARGGAIIIAVFITIWLCDSAAYFLGTAFGKHKLFPRVSPKKSWEGAIAGFLFSVLGMIVMREFFLTFMSFAEAIFFGAMVGIVGQVGDLIESMIKRDAGVKDSSSIIPGHGGIFDRFDSLLFSAPFVYLFLVFLY